VVTSGQGGCDVIGGNYELGEGVVTSSGVGSMLIRVINMLIRSINEVVEVGRG
jgi:hypothetical protein